VAAVLLVLCALPIVVGAWPVRATADPAGLRDRVLAAPPAHAGYAQATGLLGLPPIPRLSEVTALLTGTTQLRTWYAAADRWRTDVVLPGGERGIYRQPGGEYVWDFGDNRLTRIEGSGPVRLPRAADLLPPELTRRLVAAAAGDPVSALPARRIAGIAAAGVRITPADPRTTVAHLDVWADPGSGLALQVEVTGKGAARPVLVSRFLEVELTAPDPAVLVPPAVRAGMGYAETSTPDVLSALDRLGPVPLPATLGGQPRRAAVRGSSAIGLYGTGLAQYVVLAVPGRFGRGAFEAAQRYGRKVSYPDGEAAVLATSLVSVLAVRGTASGQIHLVAGLIDPAVLPDVGRELAGFRP
jgi:hypothetical protein